jgi:hypothetical protein
MKDPLGGWGKQRNNVLCVVNIFYFNAFLTSISFYVDNKSYLCGMKKNSIEEAEKSRVISIRNLKVILLLREVI